MMEAVAHDIGKQGLFQYSNIPILPSDGALVKLGPPNSKGS